MLDVKAENRPDLVGDKRSPSEISEKITEMREIESRIRKIQKAYTKDRSQELLKALQDLQRCKAEILGDAKECKLGQE